MLQNTQFCLPSVSFYLIYATLIAKNWSKLLTTYVTRSYRRKITKIKKEITHLYYWMIFTILKLK